MIGGDAVHFFGLFGDAAKEIAAAHHDGDLDAEIVDVGEFRGDFVDASGIDAETLAGGQSFAGDFEQNAFEDGRA